MYVCVCKAERKHKRTKIERDIFIKHKRYISLYLTHSEQACTISPLPLYLLHNHITHTTQHHTTLTNPLHLILHLLHLKDMMIEVLLKLFVGVIDAELFEAIGGEDFEAEDVEDAFVVWYFN